MAGAMRTARRVAKPAMLMAAQNHALKSAKKNVKVVLDATSL